MGWLLLAREGDDALVQPQALGPAPWRPEPLCDAAAEGRLPDLRCGTRRGMMGVVQFLDQSYPLVNSHFAMENHHFSWENLLFLWPFSIAILT